MIPGNINTALISGAEGGYEISRSLRFNSADSAYLSRTPASAGNRKTWTWAGWVKRSGLGTQQAIFCSTDGVSNTSIIQFLPSNQIEYYEFTGGSYAGQKVTTAVYRDPSAWYHIVAIRDTPSGTASERMRLYVNGVEITTFSTNTNPSLNADGRINSIVAHDIGRAPSGSLYFNGYLADIHFIDGQALDPSSFGEFDSNGVWQPKAYTGTYGTNGFHLPFSDNSTAAALGTDTSGNGNTWTVNNISVTAGAGNDSLVDTPTSYGTDTGAGGEVRGNYATLNPLDKGASVTLTNGNLDVSTASTWNSTRATFGLTSGKWYWEYTMTAAGYTMVGIGTSVINLAGYIGQSSAGYAFYSLNGDKWNAGSAASYGSSFTTNDVIGVAFDVDAGKVWFSKNGTWQASGDPAAGTNAAYSSIPAGNYFPTVSQDNSLPAATGGTLNAGARPFAYTAPSGFKALCTTNLPTPTIANGATAMDVKLYTGNGSTQTISGLNFSPDLVWIKARSQAYGHLLSDTVRGITKNLYSNGTGFEDEFKDYGYISASSTSDFTVTGGSINAQTVNASSTTYVAWTWDAGSSTVTNTQGSITSQVRANASAGFSVVTWTAPSSGSGWTVGHGLGAAPFLMIDKCRSNTGAWTVYHQAQGATKALYLNTTDSVQTSSIYWNDTAPSSTVFTCGTTGWYGASFTHVTYCFAPVAGYSAFGSYVGNGSADGPFVYTGFRPRYLCIKSSSFSDQWLVLDAARNTYNVVNLHLHPNLANNESSLDWLDFTSNGFKIRTTYSTVNQSSGSFIYFAFAENPFQYARAR